MKPGSAIALCMIILLASLGTSPALAKKWTITQRQVAEQSRITAGQKANELTKKEADDLRDDMAHIASRITKMKDKNGGKLSYADEGKIEKDLNAVTLKIEKLKLQKRVTAR